MRVPISWLRDYVPIEMPLEDLAERLSISSAEVEGIERRGVPDDDGNLGLFRVGNRRVLEQVRAWLAPLGQTEPPSAPTLAASRPSLPGAPVVLRCPACGQSMQLVQTIPRQSRAPPAWP